MPTMRRTPRPLTASLIGDAYPFALADAVTELSGLVAEEE